MSKGFTLWFTGLSGAGKSTLAQATGETLKKLGKKVEILDGDEVRTHLSKGLTFSKEDRDINIRRIGFICKILSRNDVVAISAAISPYRKVREEVRRDIQNFVEIYMKCSLDTLAKRDVKGLYKKALAGEIVNFTGVSDPYEEPLHPEVTIHSDGESIESGVEKVILKLHELKCLTSEEFCLFEKLQEEKKK